MSALRDFARRHPLRAYYALVFAISWGGILIIGAQTGIPGRPEDVDRLFLYALAVLFAGPSISGLTMTALVGGKAGLRDLLQRALRWRVGVRWWVVALLTGPLVVAVVLFGLALRWPDFTPGVFVTPDRTGLLLMGIVGGLIGGGLLEELGWTGFAVPTLRRRASLLATGLIVGVLWGVWHLPIAIWATSGLAREASVGSFVAGFVAFYFLALPPYRVLLVWLHDRTGSLLLVMLMHAALSASTIILQPVATHGHFVWNCLLGLALWALVAGVTLTGRAGFPRRPPPTAIARA